MSELLDAAKMHYMQVKHSHAIEDHARILVMLMQTTLFLSYITFDLKENDRLKANELVNSLIQLQKELR